MTVKIFKLSAFLITLVSLPLSASVVELLFHKSATVHDDVYYLKDIANCNGINEYCENLLYVEIGKSPEPGKMKSIITKNVLHVLSQKKEGIEFIHNGEDIVSVVMNGSKAELDGLRIESLLNEKLQEITSKFSKSYRFSVESVFIAPRYTTYEGEYAVSFDTSMWEGLDVVDEFLQVFSAAGHPVKVFLRNEKSDSEIEIEAKATIQIKQKALVSRYDVAKGAKLRTSMFKSKWIPYSRAFDLVSSNTNLGEYVAANPISPLQALRSYHLKKPLAVRRGDVVNLQIQKDNLLIGARAKALSSGKAGETIDVSVLPTKKVLKATVHTDGSIRVKL